MNNKTLLTKEGYNQLLDQLGELKKKQDHLIIEIEDVAQPDESGEDGLATQLKEELELINEKIDDIEKAFESFQIITDSSFVDGLVQVGRKVKIKISGKTEKEFTDCADQRRNHPCNHHCVMHGLVFNFA